MSNDHNAGPKIPMAEQVEALIHGRLLELRQKYAPDLSQDDAYRQLLTLARSDVVQHLRLNYRLPDLLKTTCGSPDGFYAIRVTEGMHVYYQERGVRVLEAIVSNEAEAWSHYANYLLKTSGTGLEFGE